MVVKEVFPRATIVRPADIYGHEDRLLNFYASMHRSPFHFIPILDRGNHTQKLPVYVSLYIDSVLLIEWCHVSLCVCTCVCVCY